MSERFELDKFLESFPMFVEAEGGSGRLRELALQQVFRGKFTGQHRLVRAVVRGSHAMSQARGRSATSVVVPGTAALAVGPAAMTVPEAWEWLPLVSVARLESGHTPSRSKPSYWDGGIPWIGIRDARRRNFTWIDETDQTISQQGLDNSSARLLPAGTVCLSRTASVGYVTIMKRPMATSQDFVNWVCSDRILPEYLMNLLRCESPTLRRFSKGAVHQTIYFPEVKAFHIALPPLHEQHRIVAKVDELMRLIDDLEVKQAKKRDVQARLRASALDALTKADGPEELATAWKRVAGNFEVLFERAEGVLGLRNAIIGWAVSGWLTSDSSQAGTSEPGGTSVAFSSAFKEMFTGPFGTSLKASDYVTGGTPVINPQNLRDGQIVATATTCVGKKTLDQLSTFRVRRGDVVVARRGEMGRCAVVREAQDGWLCGTGSLVLRPASRTNPDFIALFLRSPLTVARLTSDAVGSTMSNLNQRIMTNLPLRLPPIEEQHRIVAKVETLMKLCDGLEARLKTKETTAKRLVEAVVAELVA